jgi:hypothetical protein
MAKKRWGVKVHAGALEVAMHRYVGDTPTVSGVLIDRALGN